MLDEGGLGGKRQRHRIAANAIAITIGNKIMGISHSLTQTPLLSVLMQRCIRQRQKSAKDKLTMMPRIMSKFMEVRSHPQSPGTPS
jgi:hypothetical protein